MIWITEAEAKLNLSSQPYHQLVVAAEVNRILSDYQIWYSRKNESNAVSSPLNMLYGKYGTTVFGIEISHNGMHSNPPFLTVFMPIESTGGWHSLRRLQFISENIYCTRPFYIENSSLDLSWSVYRKNNKGWDDVIYSSKLKDEADQLLEFLSVDDWNKNTFVDLYESPSDWVIVRVSGGSKSMIGSYSTKQDAFSVACQMSLQGDNESQLFVTKLDSVNNLNGPMKFRAINGRMFEVPT